MFWFGFIWIKNLKYLSISSPNQKYSYLFLLESTFTLCIIRYGKLVIQPESKIQLVNLVPNMLALLLTCQCFVFSPVVLIFICSEIF